MSDEALFHLLSRADAGCGWREARRIFIRDLVVDCRIGVYPSERTRTQKVAINVELYLAPSAGPSDDDIAQVLDYDVVRRRILDLAGRAHVNLQETFVESILEACLEPEVVIGARVSTEKLEVYQDAQSVGYEVVRLKAEPAPATDEPG